MTPNQFIMMQFGTVLLGYTIAAVFIRRPIWMIVTAIISCLVTLPFLIALFSYHYYTLLVTAIGIPTQNDIAEFIRAVLPITIAPAMAIGVLARYFMKRTRRKRLVFIGGLFTAFLTMIWYQTAVFENEFSSASQACHNSDLYFALGSTALAIPANPVMLLHTGSYNNWHLHASFNEFELKDLCKQASNKSYPLKLKELTFYFPQIDGNEKDFSYAFTKKICDADAIDISNKLICQASSFKPTEQRILNRAIFFLPDYFDESSDNFWKFRYAAFQHAKEEAEKSGTPWIAKPEGIFDSYPEGYYVARDNALSGRQGYPSLVHCENSSKDGWLFCTTIRDLPNGLMGSAGFFTKPSELEQNSIAVDEALPELFSRILKPEK